MESIRALTLYPEWAHAITTFGKDVENRDWIHQPKAIIGTLLAIHAGKTIGGTLFKTREALEMVEETAENAGLDISIETADVTCSAIVALTRVIAVGQVKSPWSAMWCWQIKFGPLWTFETPIACKGKQGLWRLPVDVMESLRKQYSQYY